MKKLFLFLVCLAAYSLQAQKSVSFQAVKPAPRPAGSPAVSNFAPNTRMFLQQWNEYQNALQTAQSPKSAKLEDTYGLRTVKSAKGSVRYELPVFVRYESEAALQSAIEKGLKVNTKLPTICTGMIAP